MAVLASRRQDSIQMYAWFLIPVLGESAPMQYGRGCQMISRIVVEVEARDLGNLLVLQTRALCSLRNFGHFVRVLT